MVDFSALLRKPAGEAKRPAALPPGNYSGVIKSFELGDRNKNKTPYVRFHLGLVDWPAEVEESDRSDIDLSKRQLRRDFYLTEDALWRLDELISKCGIDANGMSYEELLPQMVGVNVLVEVQQYLNEQNNEVGNQVGAVTGA